MTSLQLGGTVPALDVSCSGDILVVVGLVFWELIVLKQWSERHDGRRHRRSQVESNEMEPKRAGWRGKGQSDSMKENHLFTFHQSLLLLAVARACVQLSVRGQGGERRRVLSQAVRKYICQQWGRDWSERREVPIAVACDLLMALGCSCLRKS